MSGKLPPHSPKKKTERHYLEVLRTISLEALMGANADERLDRLVRIVAEELNWDACSIYILGKDKNELVLSATHGLIADSVGKVRLPITEGLVGCVAREEKPLFLENASQDPRFKYFPETGEEKFHSLAAVPLTRAGKLLGVLTVQTIQPYKFLTADTHFLEILASQIGQTVDIALSLKATGESKSVILVGTAVSPGFGEARVHLMASSPDEMEFLARGFKGLKFEKELFDNAMRHSMEELDNLAAQLDELSSPAASIFLAHKRILQDPEFTEKIYRGIEEGKESAPRVLTSVMNEYIRKFAAYKSRTMREKAQDIKGLRDTLLKFMGEKVTQFAPKFHEDKMVIVMKDLTPQETARLDTGKVTAIVTESGGEYSHAAILARALNLPAVLGVSGVTDIVNPGDRLLVDGNSGFIYVNPDKKIKSDYLEKSKIIKKRAKAIQQVITKPPEGTKTVFSKVTVDANIGLPFEMEQASRGNIGSVGLFRTEFYYMSQKSWPSETAQNKFYAHLLHFFQKGVVTIRLLDLGGDKFLSYMPEIREETSTLGFRSVRLLLDHPEILRSQLRSIHLAAQRSGLVPRILIPMVSQSWEIAAVRETLREVTGGKEYPLGIMMEIPAVLFEVEELVEESDFISIGTNDLAQYLLAVDRNDSRTTNLYHPLRVALLRALDKLFKSLAVLSKPFSICGEMAGEPLSVLALLALGYRNFSLAPSRAPEIKYLLHQIPENALFRLRTPLLRASDPKDSEKLLRTVAREFAPLLG